MREENIIIRLKNLDNWKDEFALRGIVDHAIAVDHSHLDDGQYQSCWYLTSTGVKIYYPRQSIIDRIEELCRKCDVEIEIL